MRYDEPTFKGWGKPGPLPPGATGSGPELEVGETLDDLCGFFRIFQLEKGHRFSTDDVLTAWYGKIGCPSARSALDLGSGIGAVGMLAAWCLPGARFVTVEAQEESVRLARKSAQWNGLTERYEIRQGDFRDAALLDPKEKFDLVLASPPYFPLGSGSEGDHPQKVACRFETRGGISHYCQTAARHLERGGFFSCVFPVSPDEQHQRVKEAAQSAGLIIVRWRPVALREGDRPLLGLFGMMRREDLPESMWAQGWSEPTLIIRKKSGEVHLEYRVIKLSFGFPP